MNSEYELVGLGIHFDEAGSRAVTLLDSIPSLLRDFQQGKVNGYWDVLSHSR